MESHARALGAGVRLGWEGGGRRTPWVATWGRLKGLWRDTKGATWQPGGTVPCLRLTGRLDGRLGALLRAEAREVVARGTRRWQLDLGGVLAWDAEGLAALVTALDHSEQAGASLELRAPSPPIQRVLARTQLHRMFVIVDAPPRAA
ncbi:MAG: STAS domain-containing protein [Candidatus Sericytochromatia bacterium]|nr:STAS domain-containing protein [Candidatus Sericytochromatia bacterium]